MEEKQKINEMTKEIASILTKAAHMACEDIPFAPPNDYSHCNINKIECHRCKEARALIAAGYRKQSEDEGEWITHSDSYECTACGQRFYINECAEDYDPINGWSLHFCPNCGAKMKGGE